VHCVFVMYKNLCEVVSLKRGHSIVFRQFSDTDIAVKRMIFIIKQYHICNKMLRDENCVPETCFVGMRLLLSCLTSTLGDDCHGLISLAFYGNKYYCCNENCCLHCTIFVGQ